VKIISNAGDAIQALFSLKRSKRMTEWINATTDAIHIDAMQNAAMIVGFLRMQGKGFASGGAIGRGGYELGLPIVVSDAGV
jgi:hypothetical protein